MSDPQNTSQTPETVMPPRRRLKAQTRKMLAVLRGIAKGNTISLACENAGITATTFWLWRKKWPRISALTESLIVSKIQTVEDKLFNQCVNGNMTAIIFFLTNRCPERWADRRALVNNTNVFNARNAPAKDESQESVEAIFSRIESIRASLIPPDGAKQLP